VTRPPADPPRGDSLEEVLPFAHEEVDPSVPEPHAYGAPAEAARPDYPLLPGGNTPPPKTMPPETARPERKRDARGKATRGKRPQLIWVVVALLGVAVIALMLWLVSHPPHPGA
jgi:hypothetical protein